MKAPRVVPPSEPRPTPTRIHRHLCARCPSDPRREQDPEALDIAALPAAERITHVFPCAWRPHRLCKGICDQLGVDADNVAAAVAGRDGTPA